MPIAHWKRDVQAYFVWRQDDVVVATAAAAATTAIELDAERHPNRPRPRLPARRRRLGGVHLECGEMSGELCRIGALALIVL
jgi:hypothetical protein